MFSPSQKPTTSEISDARFKRFWREFLDYEKSVAREMLLDAFLDTLSLCEKNSDPMVKVQLVELAFKLHDLDPTFVFDKTFP